MEGEKKALWPPLAGKKAPDPPADLPQIKYARLHALPECLNLLVTWRKWLSIRLQRIPRAHPWTSKLTNIKSPWELLKLQRLKPYLGPTKSMSGPNSNARAWESVSLILLVILGPEP